MDMVSIVLIAAMIIGIFTFPSSTAGKIEQKIFKVMRKFIKVEPQRDEGERSGVVDIGELRKHFK
jgi:hypothetical protein